jgi:hypothetical protein
MKRVTNHYGKTEGQAWLYMPIVPATWEAKAEGKKKKKMAETGKPILDNKCNANKPDLRDEESKDIKTRPGTMGLRIPATQETEIRRITV